MVKILHLLVAIVLVAYCGRVTSQNIPLLGDLQSILDTKDTANIFITLSDGPEQIFNSILQQTFGSRANQIEALTNDLMEHANRTQQVVINVLNQFMATTGQNLTIKQYWITNQIYVQGANKVLVLLLQTLGAVIGFIREEIYAGFEPMAPKVAEYKEDEYTWGIEKINAPGAWELQETLRTLDPIVIGSIDSGVR